MRHGFILCFLLLAGLTAEAQRKFEKGYFITTDGTRTNAEIQLKVKDKRDCPSGFSYRASKAETPVEADVEKIREVGFSNGTMYRRFTVQIDRSPSDISRLQIDPRRYERSPDFRTEQLFLRLLVDGKAVLYGYDDTTLHRYFYSLEGSELKQLVYRQYLRDETADVKFGAQRSEGNLIVNEDYKQELLNALKCSSLAQKDFSSLRYEGKALSKLFVRFNKCQ